MSNEPTRESPAPTPARKDRDLGRRAWVALITLLLVALAVWFSISVLPRWWSHRVGDRVNGELTTGAILGFMYGFFAMLLPLLVLALVLRYRRKSWKAWLIGGLIALLLASPNLITLGIAVSPGDAAHAADRTLDVEAPYFRGGMVIGDEPGLIQLVATFLNGLCGNQTFGITSGTLGCEQPRKRAKNDQLNEFVVANMDNLAKDIAKGQGETLDTSPNSCRSRPDRIAFNQKLQANFATIFPPERGAC
jgi:hypothetical protein